MCTFRMGSPPQQHTHPPTATLGEEARQPGAHTTQNVQTACQMVGTRGDRRGLADVLDGSRVQTIRMHLTVHFKRV